VLHFDTAASWLVLVRDFGLVALLVLLLWPLRRAPAAMSPRATSGV